MLLESVENEGFNISRCAKAVSERAAWNSPWRHLCPDYSPYPPDEDAARPAPTRAELSLLGGRGRSAAQLRLHADRGFPPLKIHVMYLSECKTRILGSSTS
jgi:hypothetical protein